MAVPGREVDLSTLARHLAEYGPHKTLPTERRVRILINGACIADTLGTAGALFVWEHPYYPQLYLPKDALVKSVQGYELTYEDHQDVKDKNNNTIATTLKVKVQRKSDNNMKEVKDGFVVFSDNLPGKANPLSNMLKVNFSAAGKYSHPLPQVPSVLMGYMSSQQTNGSKKTHPSSYTQKTPSNASTSCTLHAACVSLSRAPSLLNRRLVCNSTRLGCRCGTIYP